MRIFLRRIALLVAVSAALVSCGGSKPADSASTSGTSAATADIIRNGNRLLAEKSPFLARHAHDPIDWFPWGDEAFEKAAKEKKAVMLVVGYSSCPWSLKMQRESYADEKIARMINDNFVPVLVDREEHPDVNGTFLYYLTLGGFQAGWPMHLWLTPDGLCWQSGIFFPTVSVGKKPSWETQVSLCVSKWVKDPEFTRTEALQGAKRFTEVVAKIYKPASGARLSAQSSEAAFEKLSTVFDPINGSFSSSPKFHQAPTLDFLLAYARTVRSNNFGRTQKCLDMVRLTLERIASGGLHDRLGGGYHRYCIGPSWQVPQFEKMLYDQAHLALVFLHAWQIWGDETFMENAKEALNYAVAELSDPLGGFYCAENAFSSSELKKKGSTEDMQEGAYYLWTKKEIFDVVGPDSGALLEKMWGIDGRGNLPIESLPSMASKFRDLNIVREDKPLTEAAKELGMPEEKARAAYAEAKKKLHEVQKKRARPPLDDKIIPSWNGLMISAFAHAGAAFQSPEYLTRAEKAADAMLVLMADRFKSKNYFSEDYATMIQALMDLYEATSKPKWITEALRLQEEQIASLWDKQGGGFWDGPENKHLFFQMKTYDDSNDFAQNGISLQNLLRLGAMTNNAVYVDLANKGLEWFTGAVASVPAGAVRMLKAYDMSILPALEFYVQGDPNSEVGKELRVTLSSFHRPNSTLAYLDGSEGAKAITAQFGAKLDLFPNASVPTVIVVKSGKVEKSFTSAAELKAYLTSEFGVPVQQ